MTQPTNTFNSFDATGNREDLSDAIYNISPTDTPFISMIGRTPATNTTHEWQTDSLAAVSTSNARIEGLDFSGQSITATSRLSNRTQISYKDIVISNTQRAVNPAGRDDELGYQVAKKGLELRRDLEAIATRNQGFVAASTAAAGKARTLEAWYSTNDSRGSSGSDGTSTGAAATDGTQRAFTEALLKDVLQKVYTSGGSPTAIMCGPVNKQKLSSFSGNATRFEDSGDATLHTAVDIYVSDFGTLRVVPNRFQRERTVHVLQPDMWAMSFLRPFQTQDVARTGDAEKKTLIAEWTLESRNQAASGVVADVTTS